MRNAILGIPTIVKGVAVLGAVSALLAGAHYVAASPENRLGLPQDWTHRHVVFSRPHDVATLMNVRKDPRFLHQLLRSGALAAANVHGAIPQRQVSQQETPLGGDQLGAMESQLESGHRGSSRPDWSMSLGAGGTFLRTTYPSKYTFNVNTAPDCVNDYVVFPTVTGGSATQATIVAFNQLYSSQGGAAGLCGNTGPAVKWAYYSTGGGIRNSAAISLDGKKVAFTTRAPGTVHVLTIGTTGTNGTGVNAPVLPGAAGGNNAVLVSVALSGAPGVSFSAVFPDYLDDVGYVGDNAGALHKITGLFNGTPAEVTTGGWPVTVGASALNSPVMDSLTNNIFVTDQGGNLSYVREIGSTNGSCAAGAPPCLGATVLAISPGTPIVDPPIVDSTNGRVFTETAGNGTSSAIIQADTALGSVVTANVGGQNTANPLHSGDFDNNYYASGPATGFYYVCGKNAVSLVPTLYRIGFNSSGVMNGSPDATTLPLARAIGQCSPATEAFNTTSGVDWLFIGVSNRCGAIPAGIPGGCAMSYNITSGMPAALTAETAERAGVSGIVIDNFSSAPQASSIYFTTEANGPCGNPPVGSTGCAVKLTQSGLQ